MVARHTDKHPGPRSFHAIISLPTRDLRQAFVFYGKGMGFPLAVETAGDEMPEPVTFALNKGTQLMIIPTGGFGWVDGGNRVAEKGTSECIVSLRVERTADVDEIIARARAAGADVTAEPQPQPWGYSATFKDLDGHVWMVVRAA
jgi:predicted lactoylglutathione lyase